MVRKIVSKTILIIIIALATFFSGEINYQIGEQCYKLPSQYALPCITRIIAINLFGFLTLFIPLISLYFWIKPKTDKQMTNKKTNNA